MRKLAYILILLAGIMISSCNDDEDRCEEWRVQEWIIEGNTYLSQPTTKERTLCNDDIKAAGTTYVFHEDGAVKYYRKLIQKL